MQLGLENKKKTIWAAVLGGLAVVVFAYEILPMFMGSSPDPASSAQAAAPAPRVSPRTGVKGKKPRVENLDPTLRLDLLASSEQTIYGGSGRNIFVSQPDVTIPQPGQRANTDPEPPKWTPPPVPPQQPIPLKFFGFASKPGEPKQIFLSMGDDVFVAGEGEIVNRRYKVVRISNNSVDIQDMVNSGPAQSIPLIQGPA